jgi:hypothetical protein
LRAIIVRQAAAQVKEICRRGERSRDYYGAEFGGIATFRVNTRHAMIRPKRLRHANGALSSEVSYFFVQIQHPPGGSF